MTILCHHSSCLKIWTKLKLYRCSVTKKTCKLSRPRPKQRMQASRLRDRNWLRSVRCKNTTYSQRLIRLRAFGHGNSIKKRTRNSIGQCELVSLISGRFIKVSVFRCEQPKMSQKRRMTSMRANIISSGMTKKDLARYRKRH
jgi:hypothetical protein